MEKLKKALAAFNIDSSQEVLVKFEKYMNLILEWNEKVNLTAITDKDEFIVKHFIDSICCAKDNRYRKAGSVIDVGTGAGFPGFPLAIISPDKEFLLIDSLNKRIKIINEIIDIISINNVKAIHGRAEEVARKKEYREQFDVCVSRAVSKMSVLSEYCLPFVKKEGFLIAYKGPEAEKEVEEGKKALFLLGGKLDEICDANMEEYGVYHKIIYIYKDRSTPKAYPRKAGTPVKQPL